MGGRFWFFFQKKQHLVSIPSMWPTPTTATTRLFGDVVDDALAAASSAANPENLRLVNWRDRICGFGGGQMPKLNFWIIGPANYERERTYYMWLSRRWMMASMIYEQHLGCIKRESRKWEKSYAFNLRRHSGKPSMHASLCWAVLVSKSCEQRGACVTAWNHSSIAIGAKPLCPLPRSCRQGLCHRAYSP